MSKVAQLRALREAQYERRQGIARGKPAPQTDSVNEKTVNKSPSGGKTAPVHSSQSEARRAYRREWMRKKREAERKGGKNA